MTDSHPEYSAPVIALSGGVGGAKLVLGLTRAMDPSSLTVIANTGDDSAFDLRVQEYQGEPVLTYWVGQSGFHGRGEVIILDDTYTEIARVSTGEPIGAGNADTAADFQYTPHIAVPRRPRECGCAPGLASVRPVGL